MQGAGYLVPNNREERLSRNRQVSSPLNNQIQLNNPKIHTQDKPQNVINIT